MKTLLIDQIESAIGTICLVSDGDKLCALDFEDYRDRMLKLLTAHFGLVDLVAATDPGGFSTQLRDYLGGNFDIINHIPTNPGGTTFQQQVWSALRQIPVGTYWTYGQLAAHLKKPGAARAVGLANSKNPISIVVPCHRVIGANQSLTGYAGGVDRKRWLLEHEGVDCDRIGNRRSGHSSNQKTGPNTMVQPSLFNL